MSTLSEISKAIQEIRKLLKQSLTPEFFKSIQSACDSVTKLLSDPNLSQNIKGTLEEFNKLLKEANEKGLVEEIVQLAGDVRKKLNEVDMHAVNNILENIGNLLEEAKNAQLIDHIADALKAAKSIGEFVELAKTFVEGPIGGVLLKYGPFGLIAGTMLKMALSNYLDKKNDSILIELLKENNRNSSTTTLTNLQMLREMKWTSYKELSKELHSGVLDFDPILLKKSKEKLNADAFFLETVPELPQERVRDLSIISNKLEELLEKFAESEIKNESLEHYLGFIGKDYEKYWNELLNYIVYSHKILPLGKPEKPQLSHHQRNYDSICRLYGKTEVQAIMSALARNLAKNGGNDLYYELANSLEDCSGSFLALAQYVSQYKGDSVQTSFPKPIVQLQTYYHEKADQYIKEEWQKIKWPIGHEHLALELDDTMVQIIKTRAFAEFCRQTSAYFFGFYPLPRELYNCILDVPRGIWHTVRHPIDTMKGFGSLFTKDGWTHIGNSIWHHPVRIITPAVITGACSYGVGHLSSILAPTTHATAHFGPISGAMSAASIKTSGALSAQAAVVSVPTVAVPNLIFAATQKTTQFTDKRQSNGESLVNESSIQVASDDWNKLLILLLTHYKSIENEVDASILINEWSKEIKYRKQAETVPLSSFIGTHAYSFFASTTSTLSSESSSKPTHTLENI